MIFQSYFDLWLDRWVNRRKLFKTFISLQAKGCALSTIYDIGANKGRWARDTRKLLPKSNFFLFGLFCPKYSIRIPQIEVSLLV